MKPQRSKRCRETGAKNLMEALETRRFASITSWTSSQLSDYSGSSYFGTLTFGDNGDATGFATGSVGQSGSQQAWSYTLWDENLDDGLDSGWRSVGMSVNWTPNVVGFFGGGGQTVGFNIGAGTQIHQVAILCDVAASGYEVDWRSLNVGFYSNGNLVELVNVGSPSVSTINASSDDPREYGVLVTPSTSSGTITGVYVSGQVRLKSAEGYYPGASDISSTIAIS